MKTRILLYCVLWLTLPIISSAQTGIFFGTVEDESNGEPLEGATVSAYLQPLGELTGSVVTGENGSYSLTLPAGQGGEIEYELVVTHTLYHSWIEPPIPLDAGDQHELHFELTPYEAIDYHGYVWSAESPDTPVSNATVQIPEIGAWDITDENGYFDLGEHLQGIHTISVSHSPPGSEGYHDELFENVEILTLLNLYLPEILAPQNLLAIRGNSLIHIEWEPPDNHTAPLLLARRQERYLATIESVTRSANPEDLAKLGPIRDKFARIEHRLNHMPEVELDQLEDFTGYRVMLDGTILDELIEEESFTADYLQNRQQYEFRVAADYGYGEEYLVWSDPVTARPRRQTSPYVWTTYEDYLWVEIRPDLGGSGIPLNLGDDDVVTGIELGNEFHLYDSTYTTINIGANGVLSFVSTDLPAPGTPFPDPTGPQGIIAPYWCDLDPGDSEEEDAWYWYDATHDRFIVLYNTGNFNGPNNNIKLFEVILDFSNQSIKFQYFNAEDGWDLDEDVVIGFEDALGVYGLSYAHSHITNGHMIQTARAIDWMEMYTNIEGTVTDSLTGEVLEGVTVGIVNGPQTTTNAYGHYTIPMLLYDDWGNRLFDLEARAEGYQHYLIHNFQLDDPEYIVTLNMAILPVDSASAPSIIDVSGRFDAGVNLQKRPPGNYEGYDGDPDTVIQYDNGEVHDAYSLNGLGDQFLYAVNFQIPGEGLLTYSEMRLTCEDDPWWPWPDDSHDPVIMFVMLNDWTDHSQVVYVSDEITTSQENPFSAIEPFTFVNQNIWVGFWNAGPGYEGICLDEERDSINDIIVTEDGGGTWQNWDGPGDPLCRAAFVTYEADNQHNSPAIRMPQEVKERVAVNGSYASTTLSEWGLGDYSLSLIHI